MVHEAATAGLNKFSEACRCATAADLYSERVAVQEMHDAAYVLNVHCFQSSIDKQLNFSSKLSKYLVLKVCCVLSCRDFVPSGKFASRSAIQFRSVYS